ncbi:MAG: hypothetical protein HY049_14690 [Acidobacteria bacterium]|nr:hypothetical protein [Acidobacteriota bacterium]
MTRPGDDREIERAFSIARDEARRRAPKFSRMWGEAGRLAAGTRGTPRWLPLAVTTAAIVAVAAAGLLFVTRRGGPPRAQPTEAEADITSWRAPTDALLETPGIEILTTLPAIGRTALTPTSWSSSHEDAHVD